MMYRYHLTRKGLGRQRPRGREEEFAPRGRPAPMRRSGGGRRARWSGRTVRITQGLLYTMTVVGLLVLAVWGTNTATHSIAHSNVFEVREVRAAGLERLNETDVLKRLRPSSGTSLFDLDLAALRERLLAEPWIKEVTLRKQYPDTLSIRVVERRPVAVLAGPASSALVDATGAVMVEGPDPARVSGPWLFLPVVHGIERMSLRDRDPGALRSFSAALEVLRAIPPMGDGDVHGGLDMDVGRWDDVRVLRHGYRFRLGAGSFDEKWQRFRSVETEIERRYEEGREIDLRFPDQVIVR
ncbi:MAG: FtsQ-type POTRA domain-containing protein [Nitrospirae bacterium]|nr:FtsQ-type POTRA domain-containing protein [Nitrospirota bacterium]